VIANQMGQRRRRDKPRHLPVSMGGA
jgi:hypothetical protein